MIRSTLAFVVAAGLATSAQAMCGTRHLYNSSPGDIVLSMHGGLCDGLDPTTRQRVNDAHDCLATRPASSRAAPKTAAVPLYSPIINIHYTNSGEITSIEVSGQVYNKRGFDVRQLGERCIIDPGGNTGNIVMNSPTEGDIKTCGQGTYACGAK